MAGMPSKQLKISHNVDLFLDASLSVGQLHEGKAFYIKTLVSRSEELTIRTLPSPEGRLEDMVWHHGDLSASVYTPG